MQYFANKLLPIFYFILALVNTNKLCQKSEDCSDQVKGRVCSFCVGDNKLTCFYPFPFIYTSNVNNHECKLVKICKQNPCKNNGQCTILEGIGYVCTCKGNYFGKQCESVHSSKLHPFRVTGGYNFDIVGKISATTKIGNTFSFKSSLKPEQSLVIVSNEGYFELFKKSKQQSETVYEALVTFPYRAYEDDANFLFLKDTVYGYLTTVHIIGYGRVSNTFKNSFSIFVSYVDIELNCVPDIKLKNCESSFFKATTYLRESNINLSAEKRVIPKGNSRKQLADSLSDCGGKTVTMDLVWNVFLINDISSNTNNIKYLVKTLNKESSISFKPFHLQFGLYWITLDATVTWKNQKSQNTGYGFFKITSLPLEPIIDKGSKRLISYRRESWTMSAKSSKDPNEASGTKATLSLMTKWSCTSDLPGTSVKAICEPRILKITEPYVIPKNEIPGKGNFNFTLEIWNELYKSCASEYCLEASKHRFAHQVVTIDIIETGVLVLDCLKNCLGTVSVFMSFIIKAKILDIESDQGNVTYNWTYGKTGSLEITSYNARAGLASYIFDLAGNSLEAGVQYTVNVTATVGKYQTISNSYSFKTKTINYSGTCNIKPEIGIEGQSNFDISCNTSQEISLTFEFYEKSSDKAQIECSLEGRMLGISDDGTLNKVKLTRRNVAVCIHHNGYHTERQLVVHLTKPSGYILDTYITKLKNYMRYGSFMKALQYISLIVDISTKPSLRINHVRVLLRTLHRIPLNTANELKMHLVTLYEVLSKVHQSELYFPDINTMTLTKETVNKLSKSLNTFEKRFTFREIKQIVKSILNIIHISSKLEEKLLAMHKYSWSNLDIDSIYDLSNSFRMVEKTMDSIKNTVTYIQLPGLLPTSISSDNDTLVLSVLKDDPDYDYTLINLLQTISNSPVQLSLRLYKSIQNTVPKGRPLVLCFIVMEDNIGLIQNFKKDSASNLLYVSLGKTRLDLATLIEKTVDLKALHFPIDVKMTLNVSLLKQQVRSGVVTQLDPSTEEETLDSLIKTHRFDMVRGSLMAITFLYPPSNSSLRVSITEGYRPSYNTLVSKHHTVNEETPTYTFRSSETGDEERSFIYMMILPGLEVSVNNSVAYSFTLNNTVCKYWSRMKWSSLGCKVGNETKGNQVHCQCTHLSILESVGPYLPNKLDPFADAYLFLTVHENPIIVYILVAILIFYLIALVWANIEEKKDKIKCFITVLDDNFPGDEKAYLLAVFTSSRFFTGTNANVGIRLEGEHGSSRAHILKSPHHRVMTRGSDCWFLMFSPKSLGLLENIHIWHDNSGASPSWHCSEVHVYDLDERTETIFIVDQWLELSLETHPEAVVLPTTAIDYFHPRRLFVMNVLTGMKVRQSLSGVFSKHPRSIVTRVQLLNVSVSTVMISMLSGIMFYKDSIGKPEPYFYYLEIRDIIVSVIILAVVYVFGLLIRLGYSKSKAIADKKTNVNSLYLRGSHEYFLSRFPHSKAFAKTVNKRDTIVSTLKKIISPTTLAPVTLDRGKRVVKTQIFWSVIAWLSFILNTFLCIYIIVLYGLKLGVITSTKWVTSVSLSFAQDSFCITPLLLVALSIMLTTSSDLFTITNNYNIERDEVINSFPNDKSKENFKRLSVIRAEAHYKPLANQIRAETFARLKRVDKWLQLLKFLTYAVFVYAQYYLAETVWGAQYYVNDHLAQLIVSPRFKNVAFRKAQSIATMNKYMRTTFLKALYRSTWYNKQPLNKDEKTANPNWVSDFTWKVLGVASFRQLRVVPKSCGNIFFPNTTCIPAWSFSSEDKSNYNAYWIPAWNDQGKGTVSPWRYSPATSSWIDTCYRLWGASGTVYHNGGYIADLHPSAQLTLGTVSDLIEKSWQDKFTKVVFIELSLLHTSTHNNSRLLSKITLIAEYTFPTHVLKVTNVYTVFECMPWNIWHITCGTIILIFFLELCYKINRDGFVGTFKKIEYVIVLLIVVLGFCGTYLRCVEAYQCRTHSFEERHHYSMTTSFDYDAFLSYYMHVGRILSLLLLLSVSRTIILLVRSNILYADYKVLTTSLYTAVWLQLLLMIVIYYIRQMCFQTYDMVWQSLTQIAMHYSRVAPSHVHFNTTMIILLMVKYILSTIIFRLMLVVFIYIKRTTVSDPELHSGFVSFLKSELKRFCFSINKQTK